MSELVGSMPANLPVWSKMTVIRDRSAVKVDETRQRATLHCVQAFMLEKFLCIQIKPRNARWACFHYVFYDWPVLQVRLIVVKTPYLDYLYAICYFDLNTDSLVGIFCLSDAVKGISIHTAIATNKYKYTST